MEDFRIDIMLGEGVNARTINMPLQPFTLIGATTRSGMLSAPLRDRFQMREHLDFYTRRRTGRDRPPQRRASCAVQIDDDAALEDRRPQPRHAAHGQQPPPLGPRLRHQPRPTGDITLRGRRRGARHAGDRSRWASTRRIASTWKRSLRVFHGGPAGVEAIAHTMNTATRHADRRSRAVPAPLGTRRPHAARPEADRSKGYEHLGATPEAGFNGASLERRPALPSLCGITFAGFCRHAESPDSASGRRSSTGGAGASMVEPQRNGALDRESHESHRPPQSRLWGGRRFRRSN